MPPVSMTYRLLSKCRVLAGGQTSSRPSNRFAASVHATIPGAAQHRCLSATPVILSSPSSNVPVAGDPPGQGP